MRIAIASEDFHRISGNAEHALNWLVFDTELEDHCQRLTLQPDQDLYHHIKGHYHPLDSVSVMIARSADEYCIARMRARGVDFRCTSETDPQKALADYRAGRLASPDRANPMDPLAAEAKDYRGFGKHP